MTLFVNSEPLIWSTEKWSNSIHINNMPNVKAMHSIKARYTIDACLLFSQFHLLAKLKSRVLKCVKIRLFIFMKSEKSFSMWISNKWITVFSIKYFYGVNLLLLHVWHRRNGFSPLNCDYSWTKLSINFIYRSKNGTKCGFLHGTYRQMTMW